MEYITHRNLWTAWWTPAFACIWRTGGSEPWPPPGQMQHSPAVGPPEGDDWFTIRPRPPILIGISSVTFLLRTLVRWGFQGQLGFSPQTSEIPWVKIGVRDFRHQKRHFHDSATEVSRNSKTKSRRWESHYLCSGVKPISPYTPAVNSE